MKNSNYNYQGPNKLESFMKKKRMKNKTLAKEKTAIKYFRVSLEEKALSYKNNKTLKDWRRKIPFEKMIRLIPRLGDSDLALCDYKFGFQLITYDKDLVLFCDEEIIYYNWLRVLEFIVNGKEIGSFDNFKKKFPQTKPPTTPGSKNSNDDIRKITSNNVIKKGSQNTEKELLVNVNEKDGTIRIGVIPKTTVDFKIFKDHSDRINAKQFDKNMLPLGANTNSGKQIPQNIKSSIFGNRKPEQQILDGSNKRSSQSYSNKNILAPKLQSENNIHDNYTETTVWTVNEQIDNFNENKYANKNIEPKTTNRDDTMKRLFFNDNPLHIKNQSNYDKIQIENLHCGIDDNSEKIIDNFKNVKIGSTPMRVPNKAEVDKSLNSSQIKNTKKKQKFYIDGGENNINSIKNGGKVDKDIVEGFDNNSWVLNLTIKEK